jgi:hypothetical protein
MTGMPRDGRTAKHDRPGVSFPAKEGISIMTSEVAAAECAAFITDLGELAGRVDVVLANPWIGHAEFLRDIAAGLTRAAEALPGGPDRDRLADLARDIGGALVDPRADRETCLRAARDALGGLPESMGAALRAAADRAAWVAGLRELADFLAAHPDVPVPPAYHTQGICEFPDGDSDAERRAGVDRAAAALGVRAAGSWGGHYKASARFGPVEYAAVAIPRDAPAEDSAAAGPEADGAAA